MSKKGLQWTSKQKQVAELLRQGLDPQAVMEKVKVSKATVSKVAKAIKAELKHPETTSKPGNDGEEPHGQTHLMPRVASEVSVGEILIEPADWRVNQEGALVIIGGHRQAKQRYGYTGTVGDFLCDCVNIVRTFMGLDLVTTDYFWKEDIDGRREQTSQGTGVLAQVGQAAGGGEPEPRN
jgi:hypothetical protein